MRKISLQTAVSLAEIVSALTVVITLIYATSEWKRSKALENTDIETIIYERMMQIDLLIAEDSSMADIVIRAADDPESLTPVEHRRFLALEHIFYDSWEAAVEAHELGILDPVQFEGWDDWFAAEAARRPRIGWTGNIRNYNPPFIEYVQERLNNGP